MLGNILQSPIIRDFRYDCKALKYRRKHEDTKVSKIVQDAPMIKWLEASNDCLCQLVRIRMTPLLYEASVSADLSERFLPLVLNSLCSEEFGSIEEETIG